MNWNIFCPIISYWSFLPLDSELLCSIKICIVRQSISLSFCRLMLMNLKLHITLLPHLILNLHLRQNTVQELLDDVVRKSVRDENNLVLLPKQLWSSVKEREDETFCEVGWLFDQGHAITSKCIFSPDAGLKASNANIHTATHTSELLSMNFVNFKSSQLLS